MELEKISTLYLVDFCFIFDYLRLVFSWYVFEIRRAKLLIELNIISLNFAL